LKVENLTKYYTSGYLFTKKIRGAENVSFELRRGEVLSLVGQSGSGKTTVANMILRLIKPSKGTILLEGKDAFSYDEKHYWIKVQAIFQDPFSSFNYFYPVDKPLMDAFNLLEKTSSKKYSESEKKEIVESTLRKLGINPHEILGRYPHQVSGGQLQRLLIARALIIDPDLLVADEPTSLLDASTRLGILNELLQLKEKRGMSILFITHDMGQAYYISDRAAVMNKGKIVEIGPVEEVFFNPKNTYTKTLISSVPKIHEKWNI